MGKHYKDYYEILYNLQVQHVGSSGPCSKITAKHKNKKNGKCCCLYLKGHFLTNSQDHTKAWRAEKKIYEWTYSGGNHSYKIKEY